MNNSKAIFYALKLSYNISIIFKAYGERLCAGAGLRTYLHAPERVRRAHMCPHGTHSMCACACVRMRERVCVCVPAPCLCVCVRRCRRVCVHASTHMPVCAGRGSRLPDILSCTAYLPFSDCFRVLTIPKYDSFPHSEGFSQGHCPFP